MQRIIIQEFTFKQIEGNGNKTEHLCFILILASGSKSIQKKCLILLLRLHQIIHPLHTETARHKNYKKKGKKKSYIVGVLIEIRSLHGHKVHCS